MHQHCKHYDAGGFVNFICTLGFTHFTVVVDPAPALMMLPRLDNETYARKQPSSERTKDSSFQP